MATAPRRLIICSTNEHRPSLCGNGNLLLSNLFFVCLCAAAQESKPPNARNVTATVAPPMTPEKAKGGAGALSLFSVNSVV